MTQQTQSSNLLKRVGITLLILIIYMLGCTIPVPLTSISSIYREVLANSSVGIMSFMSGSNLQRLSLFMVGLNPLMIAMMIVQLLMMLRLFYFDTLSTNQVMRFQQWLTLILAVIQSLAITLGLHITKTLLDSLAVTLILTAGSLFVVWLGNINMKFGIGGTITIILFNIISGSFPSLIRSVKLLSQQRYGIIMVVLAGIVGCIILVFWIAFNRAYYPIKIVNTMMSSHDKPIILPLGLNMGAMMTYMVGMSLLMVPTLLINVLGPRSIWANPYFNMAVSGGLAFVLFYFFTFVQFDPKEQAKTMLHNNNYIIGIRPGEPTKKYLQQVVLHVSFIGAVLNAIQLSFGLLGSQILGKFAGLAIIPMNMIMIVMFMQGIKDQLLMLLFPLRYAHLMKDE
ncbi:accessory Sec system protein translocase subunit SecY2 [Limosilactobacillus reuteri]|uniref:Accessory Sec system protein translocase subunit SecY2 n=1 Tax=Limosilactobacillus reuteri TaxID=1598 RepID=A0A256VBZ6_LIMRT|nr:accessory Sec system protein translocase subunit SecY2 [Limosilactobacillus reuteri]MCC4368669.1 accessory Sec system protein translocase subunit SecY2 [Limosilactobacillus reuteri]MCR1863898.1 accessory Sec system protein translocase subunit SecY2 [Limosilactobacillus reuteri]MCR1893641.1 accessory Sec system protein translocase subunit SecY2 [Limosilactobacillus reuteri]MCT3199426.1 accessory Sec system protein translocase subunit SecY2 [Limosilactobacillus reuteri]MCT3207853.1 accessory 